MGNITDDEVRSFMQWGHDHRVTHTERALVQAGAKLTREYITATFLVAAHDVTTDDGGADYVESFSRERCIAIVRAGAKEST